jgi:hypothetical protein
LKQLQRALEARSDWFALLAAKHVAG